MTRLLAALLGLGACAGPPAPAPDAPRPLLRLAPSAADTVAVGAAGRVWATDGLAAEVLPDGRLAVRSGAGFVGVGLVHLGGGAVLAVQSTEADEALRLDVVGPRPGDPSVLDLRLSADGPGGLPDLEEEDAVALWGDALVSDNAYDVDAGGGVVGVDLDAVGPGRGRLRVVVRTGRTVSNWVEVEVADRRPVR